MKINPDELLCISIPTYNRVETLKEALPDLIQKIKKYHLKIFIADNNSFDGTEDYILELKKEYPFIYYNRFENTTGIKNVIRALHLGDCPYVLALGDHYILHDDSSIDRILHYLQNEPNLDALVLHYKNRLMIPQDDCIYTDKDKFLEELGWYIGMLCTVVYSKKLIDGSNHNNTLTNFPQTVSLLDYISRNKFKIQYISNNIVWNTKGGVRGSKSWHSSALEVFTTSWRNDINSLPDTFSEKSKVCCIKNHSKYTIGFFSFKSMMLYHYAGGMSLYDIFKNFKSFYFITGLNVIFQAIFIAMIPKGMIKYIFKKEYKYIKRVLGNIDSYNI